MNKKRLSVVMAGAMLASSVAPVLAAEVQKHEVNLDNRGILIGELRNLLGKKFADVKENGDLAGKSVYDIKIHKPEGFYTLDTAAKLEKYIKEADNNDVVKVTDKGHQEVNGKFYHKAQTAIEGKDATWERWELERVVTNFEAGTLTSVSKVEWLNNDHTSLKVVSKKAIAQDKHLEYVCEVGGKQYDFHAPLTVDNKEATAGTNGEWDSLEKYKELKENGVAVGDPISSSLVAEITLTDVDAKHNVVLSDLYDGLLLTDKGQELLDAINEYRNDKNSKTVVTVSHVISSGKGVFEVKVEFASPGKKVQVSIKSDNNEKITIFKNWLHKGQASVEVLAGANRYETAVKVAKENASIKDVAINGNIVLVNGDALVDGLAAAPLAASVWNKKNDETDVKSDTKVAPILLTESDTLPKATREYMRELVKYQQVGKLDRVTVYLVGGESVLSPALEQQLKDFGLRVKRAGGANREETSLKVAKLMEKENLDSAPENAFIVGAEGEPDAMSIASVAAARKQPIIVSKFGGLSTDAIDYLVGGKKENAKKATLVGGEAVISKATEDALKAEDVKIERVFGSNRKATNAAVINRYYANGFHRFVLSKDGQSNESHLVDALTATSLAVKHHAPIVLATDKLSKDQVNALELASKRDNTFSKEGGFYVYQVGHGVSKNVLQTIAERLGLAYK